MGRLKDKIFYTAAGASSGLMGLALISRCGGSACAACFGCAGTGMVILTLALVQRLKGGGRDNGMA